MARIGLVAGLFLVPLALLILGHRLRERSPRQHSAFWGGVIGHSTAMLIGMAALQFPPVLWSSDVRVLIAFWSMLLGGLAGAAIGALRTTRRRS